MRAFIYTLCNLYLSMFQVSSLGIMHTWSYVLRICAYLSSFVCKHVWTTVFVLWNALITYSCVCELCVDYCVMCCISVRTYPHVLKYVWTTVFVFVSLRAFVFFCFILLVLCAPCNLLCGHKSEWVCFIFYTVPVSHRLCFQLKVYTST